MTMFSYRGGIRILVWSVDTWHILLLKIRLARGSGFLHGAVAAAPNMFAMSTCVPLNAVVSVRGMVPNCPILYFWQGFICHCSYNQIITRFPVYRGMTTTGMKLRAKNDGPRPPLSIKTS